MYVIRHKFKKFITKQTFIYNYHLVDYIYIDRGYCKFYILLTVEIDSKIIVFKTFTRRKITFSARLCQ